MRGVPWPLAVAIGFTAHISGTGTDQSARAVFWNQNGTWYVNKTSQYSGTSNQPEFLVSSSVPSIKTSHSNNYNIETLCERIVLDEGNGTDNTREYYGADGFMSSITSTEVLSYNVGTTTSRTVWHSGNMANFNSPTANNKLHIKSANYSPYVENSGGTYYTEIVMQATFPLGNNQYAYDMGKIRVGATTQDWNKTYMAFSGGSSATAEIMRLMGNGNVGIGTTDPGYLLDVNGQARFNTATVTGTSANLPFLVATSNGNDMGQFTSQLTTYARLRIDCSSPGDAQIAFMSAQSSKWSIGNDAGDSHKFKIKVGLGEFSGSETFLIQTDGNVGIGIYQSALTKLHVFGTITGTSKNFIIDHPTKEGMKLVHSSLEGTRGWCLS